MYPWLVTTGRALMVLLNRLTASFRLLKCRRPKVLKLGLIARWVTPPVHRLARQSLLLHSRHRRYAFLPTRVPSLSLAMALFFLPLPLSPHYAPLQKQIVPDASTALNTTPPTVEPYSTKPPAYHVAKPDHPMVNHCCPVDRPMVNHSTKQEAE